MSTTDERIRVEFHYEGTILHGATVIGSISEEAAHALGLGRGDLLSIDTALVERMPTGPSPLVLVSGRARGLTPGEVVER